MKSINVSYKIEGEEVVLNLIGETFKGSHEILVNQDINLIHDLHWNNQGFHVDKFIDNSAYESMISGIEDLVKNLLSNQGVIIDDKFTLEKYHHYVDDQIHLNIAKILQPGFPVSTFPIDFDILNERVSEIINKNVKAESKYTGLYNFYLRIVRPQKFQDNNPPHRDVWLNRLRNAINIYVPICGSNQNTSLPLIEGSHLYYESEIERTKDGAMLNGTSYSVPCVISCKDEEIDLIRPQVGWNEIMVFSPYLIHGGAYNFEKDTTRISLEARFWKV